MAETMSFPKTQRWKSPKYRNAAKDQPCTMRLPCCNGDPATTVLAHANGAGVAMKADDYNAADMCSACHDLYDGRIFDKCDNFPKHELQFLFKKARYETIINRIRRKIIK